MILAKAKPDNLYSISKYPTKYAYLPALDSLRFIAFLMILANHTNITKLVNGHSFFFTLTGFLIAYISLEEVRITGKFDFRKYLIRRYLRTLPLFYLATLATFFLALLFKIFLNEHITTGKVWPYILLIHNYFQQNIMFSLANLWAMGVTEQFYFVIGLLFLFFPRLSFRHAAVIILFGLLINFLCIKIFDFYNRPYSYHYIINFGVGILLAVLGTQKSRFTESLKVHNIFQVVVGYLISATLLAFGFYYDTSYSFTAYQELVLSAGYSYIIFNLAFGKIKPFKLDQNTYLQKLGKQTFSMYCWHSYIVIIIQKIFLYLGWQLYPLLIFILCLPLTILAGHLSFQYIDKPILALKKRFY